MGLRDRRHRTDIAGDLRSGKHLLIRHPIVERRIVEVCEPPAVAGQIIKMYSPPGVAAICVPDAVSFVAPAACSQASSLHALPTTFHKRAVAGQELQTVQAPSPNARSCQGDVEANGSGGKLRRPVFCSLFVSTMLMLSPPEFPT